MFGRLNPLSGFVLKIKQKKKGNNRDPQTTEKNHP